MFKSHCSHDTSYSYDLEPITFPLGAIKQSSIPTLGKEKEDAGRQAASLSTPLHSYEDQALDSHSPVESRQKGGDMGNHR